MPMASSSNFLLMRILISSSFSVRFVTWMPCTFIPFFGGSIMVPTAAFSQFCSLSVLLSICFHSCLILTWFFSVLYSIMLVSDSSLDRVLSFCFGMHDCFESSLRLCQAPSSIRFRKWSIFGKTTTGRVCLVFLF